MLNFIKAAFDPNRSELQKARKLVQQINSHESAVKKLTDAQLAQSTEYFRKKLSIDVSKLHNPETFYQIKKDGTITGDAELKALRNKLLDMLPEVFARVREAAHRVANHRHFDVQLISGILLSHNKVTEVYTGEGKTNVAILASYLYALAGRGVHVVTVNDYLARRDAEWAGHVLAALGMQTGVITPQGAYKYVDDQEALKAKGDTIKADLKNKDLSAMATLTGSNLVSVTKHEAYQADITYGQANEFGFDYLRDNMATDLTQRVQMYHFFSIVDEADSILIDEARTPLIISAPDTTPSDTYERFATIAKQLVEEQDYTVDEKSHSVMMTEDGMQRVEEILNEDNIWENYLYAHHLDNALKAKALYRLDKEYIVKNNEVLIVDQFTGRVLPGRRYSDGVHQAIEAKEGVPVKEESKTLATVTFQNYFRLYQFLAGMTGTALTEAEEFAKIYDIDVIQVPTYRPIVRQDKTDVIYKTQEGKFNAVVEDIKAKHAIGQPILVGTTSVGKSELLSTLLKQANIKHEVLNAKQHEREAKIIAKAGKKGAVTIATNMAGRGTDIKLGEGVKDSGGLYIIGTERHEARRIDNQLRGRSGRLGDPGASQFYVSLEDDLMRIFGGDMMKSMMNRTGVPEDMPIQSGMISRLIESSQKKVEAQNFDIRKRLVDYDDVLNKQRDAVYDLRKRLLILLQQEPDDLKKLKSMDAADSAAFDVNAFANFLDAYTITDPYRDIEQWGKPLAVPLRLWLLKQIFSQLQIRLGSQEADDQQTSKEELAHVWEFLDSILPDDLQNKAVRALKHDSFDSFKESVIKVFNPRNIVVAREPLLRFLVQAFIFQFASLPSDQASQDFEKFIVLEPLDTLWMEHLEAMDDLKEGIGLRGYGQRDPLVEYKQESAGLFGQFFLQLSDQVTKRLYRVRVATEQQVKTIQNKTKEQEQQVNTIVTKADVAQGGIKNKPNRNDPCPCGSGKKYKKCHWPLYG